MSVRLFVHYLQNTIGELALGIVDDAVSIQHRLDQLGTRLSNFHLATVGRIILDHASHHFFAESTAGRECASGIFAGCSVSRTATISNRSKPSVATAHWALTIDASSESEPKQFSVTNPLPTSNCACGSIGTPNAFSDATGQNEVRLSLAGCRTSYPCMWTESRSSFQLLTRQALIYSSSHRRFIHNCQRMRPSSLCWLVPLVCQSLISAFTKPPRLA